MTNGSRPAGTVERAIELVRTGSVRSLTEIRKTLLREGCVSVDQHLSGSTLKKQLQQIISARLQDGAG